MDHGERRVRKRFGLPKKAIAKLVETALAQGRPTKAFEGSFRRYLDGLYLKHGKAENVRVYGHYIFLFDRERRLITAWQVPDQFKKKHKLLAA